MKKSRFSDEQIIGFLRQAEAGMSIPELCRSGGFSQATRVRQLRSQVFVSARAHFQKCHYSSANCSGAAGFAIPKA